MSDQEWQEVERQSRIPVVDEAAAAAAAA